VKAGEDIRPAIESLKSAGGGTLVLLAGVHRPTYDIRGSSKVNIVGEGRGQTIIDFNAASYQIKYIDASSFFLKEFTIKSSAKADGGVFLQSCTDFYIEMVASNSNTGDGFYLESCQQYQILRSGADSNTGSGFSFRSGDFTLNNSLDFTTIGCLSENNGASGYRLVTAGGFAINRFVFSGCFANSNTGDGFSFEDATNVAYGQATGCGGGGNAWTFDVDAYGVGFVGCFDSSGTQFLRTSASCDAITIVGCSPVGVYDLLGAVSVTGGFINYTIGGTYAPLSAFNNRVDEGHAIQGVYGGGTTTEVSTRMMLNSSGGSLTAGDVVVFNAATDGDEITTTTTQGDDFVGGMLLTAVSNTKYGLVVTEGYTKLLKVDGTTDIAIGDFLGTFTTAGIAMKAAAGDMAFAIALEAYTTDDSSGIIDALLIKPRKI